MNIFLKSEALSLKCFHRNDFNPMYPLFWTGFLLPIYTEVRDQETRKELSRANFLISFPPFFATKYGKITIQHCHGWLRISIGFLRHLSGRFDLIFCGTLVTVFLFSNKSSIKKRERFGSHGKQQITEHWEWALNGWTQGNQ